MTLPTQSRISWTAPTRCGAQKVLPRCKYTGENLHNISELYLEQQHKTLSEAVVELWSNSKAHADNMTSSRYGEIGVGLARGIDKDGFDCWYCVQVFLLDGCEVTWVDTPASK